MAAAGVWLPGQGPLPQGYWGSCTHAAGSLSPPLSFESGRGAGSGGGTESKSGGKKRKCTSGRVPFGTGVRGQGHTPMRCTHSSAARLAM